MHMPGIWGLIIVALLVFLLFGKPGRLSGAMEDLGKGIRGFRKGLSDSDNQPPAPPPEPPRQVADQTRATENAANGDRTQS